MTYEQIFAPVQVIPFMPGDPRVNGDIGNGVIAGKKRVLRKMLVHHPYQSMQFSHVTEAGKNYYEHALPLLEEFIELVDNVTV